MSQVSELVSAQRYFFIQKINNIPSLKARSAAVNLAEFYGNAVALGDVQSPISNTKCAYWHIVESYHVSSRWFLIALFSVLSIVLGLGLI